MIKCSSHSCEYLNIVQEAQVIVNWSDLTFYFAVRRHSKSDMESRLEAHSARVSLLGDLQYWKYIPFLVEWFLLKFSRKEHLVTNTGGIDIVEWVSNKKYVDNWAVNIIMEMQLHGR